MARQGLWLVSLALIAASYECVEIEDKGYKVTVAISKDVPQDLGILTQLQDAFRSASEYLHTASRKYFYFSHVTILVPETWTKSPDWTVSELTFKEADIRVETPHPTMGNNPYTFQPGLCGVEGRYIHLTPDFVLDNKIKRDSNYGDFGRLLVHEFAHLRYGVFDEYGSRQSTQHPVYYLDDGSTLRPTACSHEMNGTFVDTKTDLLCTLDDNTRPFTKDCDFYVNDYFNEATSSIMFKQLLKKVVHFCETNPTNPKLKHNANAPNQQNKMCNGRGTWDIISEHPDVIYGNTDAVADTSPTFEIQQRQIQVVENTTVCGRRFVFVLDVSKSMQENNRYFKLRQMADKIIRDILPVGTEVGIVTFSSSASVLADMRYLKTESDRQTLADVLPTKDMFVGATATGQGLLKGIELLEDNNKKAKGGRVFLITDGVQNIFPYVQSILTNVVKKEVVVHTLAYSAAADPIIQELSKETYGQYSYFDESDDSTALEGAGERLLKDINLCDGSDDGIEIDRRATVLDSATTSYERTVLIDSTVGNNTLFVFTLSQNATTEISIKGPNGQVYNTDSPEYNKDETLNIVRFRFPETEAGEWSYELKRGSTSTESVVGVVKSHPRTPGTLPFEIESWLGKTSFSFDSDTTGLPVYAYVHQGIAPILNADVKVVITGRNNAGEKVEIEKTLMDNGILPDNTEVDGIYSNHVVGFKSNSRHALEVTVKSNDDTVILKSGNLLSRAPVSFSNLTIEPIYEAVEQFSRVASIGAVDVQPFNESVDQFDPSRVTDLEAAISDRDSKEVTLTWTAPGDDLNEGTVSRYDIRMAKTFEDLRKNFTDSYEILESDIKEGSSTPVPAGSKQNMTLSLSGHLDSEQFVFGLKAIDDGNRSSELSNLKTVTFENIILPEPPRTITTTTASTTTTNTSEETSNTKESTLTTTPSISSTNSTVNETFMSSENVIIIAAAVSGGVLVVVAVTLGCLICINLRRSTKPPQQNMNV